MSEFTQDLILHYFMIGSVATLLMDLMIRFVKTSEPFTVTEILISITIWPVVLIVFIINIFRKNQDV